MAAGPIELEYCTSNGADIAYADVEPAIDTDKVLLLRATAVHGVPGMATPVSV